MKTHTKEDYAAFNKDYELARVRERKGWQFIAENIDGLWDQFFLFETDTGRPFLSIFSFFQV